MTAPREHNVPSTTGDNSTLNSTAPLRIGSDLPEFPEDNAYALTIDSDEADPGEEIIPNSGSYVPPHWAPGSSPLLFLPDELRLMVLADLPPESADTLHLSMASQELRLMSLAKFWSIVKEDRTLINLLLHPQDIQQAYANLIRELHMNPSHPRINVSHLSFNMLERLVIRMPPLSDGGMMSDISNLLGPRLTHLKLYEARGGASISDAAQVANFLPYLNRSPGLRHLDIGIRVDAQPAEFLSSLQACTELEALYVHHQDRSETSLKVDHGVLKHIFENGKIKKFYWSQELGDETIFRALEGIPPHQGLMLGLSHITLKISSEAASVLLPRLHSIESLVLYILDTGDILQSVGTMQQLTRLHLEYQVDMVLDRVVLQPLQSLNLIRLTIRPSDPVELELDANAITPDDLSYIFGSQNTLKRLEVFWDTDAEYFKEALTDVMWRLTQAYPALEDLVVADGILKLPLTATMASDATAPAVMFPKLRHLKIFGLQQPPD